MATDHNKLFVIAQNYLLREARMVRMSKSFNAELSKVSDDECSKILVNENEDNCPYNRFQFTAYMKSLADTCNSYMKMPIAYLASENSMKHYLNR